MIGDLAFVAPAPASPAHRLGELVAHALFELHAGDMAEHDGGEMNGGGGVGVSAAGLDPERFGGRALSSILAVLGTDDDGVEHALPAVRARRIEDDFLAADDAGIVAANAGGHGEQLTEFGVKTFWSRPSGKSSGRSTMRMPTAIEV